MNNSTHHLMKESEKIFTLPNTVQVLIDNTLTLQTLSLHKGSSFYFCTKSIHYACGRKPFTCSKPQLLERIPEDSRGWFEHTDCDSCNLQLNGPNALFCIHYSELNMSLYNCNEEELQIIGILRQHLKRGLMRLKLDTE